MGNRLFEIFWQQCQTHILKSKSQEPSLDLSLSESSGSRTTEECQVKAAGGISWLNHNRSFLEGGNQSSAFWTITFIWCQVRTTVAPGELWLIIYLCNPKGSWMYMVPSPVGWQIKIYQSWWWIVLDLQQFGGLLYTQLAKPGTLGGHRQAPGWRGSRVEYGLSRNEEHWRTMDRETVMIFFAWNLGPLKCWCFRCFHGIDIPNLLPSTTLSQVRGELKSEAENLWVPGVAAFGATRFPWGGPAGSQPLQFQLLRSQELGTLPIQLVPCTFWDVLRRLTSSFWRSRGSCNVNLKWRSSVAAHRHSFRSFVGRIKKNRTLFFCSDLRKELLRKREHELRQMEMHLGVDGIRAPGIRCSRWFKVHHATAFIFPWQFWRGNCEVKTKNKEGPDQGWIQDWGLGLGSISPFNILLYNN